MQSFYLTFGQQYRRIPHPVWPGCHPDGYMEIKASSSRQAKKFVNHIFNNTYCSMHDEEEFNKVKDLYPCGLLKVMEVSDSYNIAYIISGLQGCSEEPWKGTTE